jgi:hypothetical protein
MGVKTYDVDLSHSGRKIARKFSGEQGRSSRFGMDGNLKVIKNWKQNKVFSILI